MWVFETGKMNGTGYLLLATGNISQFHDSVRTSGRTIQLSAASTHLRENIDCESEVAKPVSFISFQSHHDGLFVNVNQGSVTVIGELTTAEKRPHTITNAKIRNFIVV